MLGCRQVGSDLPQYIADGEPELACHDALRAHLALCPHCRAYAERLHIVERALQSYPLASPNPQIVTLTMRRISAQEQAAQEEWRLLPWDVWVPAVAFFLAIVVAMMCLPPNLLPAVPLTDLERTVIIESAPIPLGLQMNTELFWALWLGLSVIAAGLGLSLGLSHWNAANSKSLGRLETHVTDAATKLWDYARRTH